MRRMRSVSANQEAEDPTTAPPSAPSIQPQPPISKISNKRVLSEVEDIEFGSERQVQLSNQDAEADDNALVKRRAKLM